MDKKDFCFAIDEIQEQITNIGRSCKQQNINLNAIVMDLRSVYRYLDKLKLNVVDGDTGQLNSINMENKLRTKNDDLGMLSIQRKAFDLMCSGTNVFLSGEAGTGKSYVLNRFTEFASQANKNVVVCAPTGIAAIDVGGSTVHRVFNAPLDPIPENKVPKKFNDVILQADVIIFEEISMMCIDLFSWVCKYILGAEKESKRHKQVIVVGDFFQLPPVIDDNKRELIDIKGHGFPFMSPMWDKMNFTPVILNEVVRQNEKEFVSNLNKVRIGDASAINWLNTHASPEENDGVYLCATKKRATDINEQKLAELDTERFTFSAIIDGELKDNEKPTDDELTLCVGAKVMLLVNDPNDAYQNGTIGVIKEIIIGADAEKNEEDILVIDIDDDRGKRTVNISRHIWKAYDYQVQVQEIPDIQTTKNEDGSSVETTITRYKKTIERTERGSFEQFPVKLAYAITIHKAQGKTFNKVNLYPYCFEAGQLYVALSRVTNIKGLHLMHNISYKSLQSCAEVVDFYNSLSSK